jgi:uncharacterized protein YgiM (DUF1202 family)
MFTRTVKTAALAAALLVAATGASMAAQYAWVDHDTYLYEYKNSSSDEVGYAWEGQKVKVLATTSNWAKVKANGDIGWVKKNKLDWAPTFIDYPGYGYGGGSVCAGGSSASFCFSVGY